MNRSTYTFKVDRVNDIQTFSKRLKKFMHDNNWSTRQLATHLNVCTTTINKWRNCEVLPSNDNRTMLEAMMSSANGEGGR